MRKRPSGLKSLPKSSNGTHRIAGSFGILKYQREEIRRRAWSKGWTVSRYVNHLLWSDWLQEQDRRVTRKRRK